MDRETLMAAMRVTAAPSLSSLDVDGWGKLHVRQLTVAEVEDQADDTKDKKDKHRLARAAARLICDDAGNRIFDHADDADVQLLAQQPWHMLQKVLEVSGRLIKGNDEGN